MNINSLRYFFIFWAVLSHHPDTEAGLFGPSTYEDCVLEGVKNAKVESAVGAIISSCNQKFNRSEKQGDSKFSYRGENSERKLKFIKDSKNSLAYYPSTITKSASGAMRVWVHFPGADPSSEKDIERLSEILVEISCPTNSWRFLRYVRDDGKVFAKTPGAEWEYPTPVDDSFLLLKQVCSE